MTTKKEFLSQLFSMFEQDRLDYFVIGEYQSLPDDTDGSDVDMVVSSSDAIALQNLMLTHALKEGLVLVSYYKNDDVKMYRFIASDWGVQIDILVGGVFYRGTSYYPIDGLKKHIVRHNGIRVLERQYGFCFDFFKEMLHKGNAKAKYCEAFLSAVKEDEARIKEDVIACYSLATWDLLSQLHSMEQLNSSGRQIRSLLLQSMQSISSVLRKIAYQSKRLGRLFQPRPGYVIVVEGTDGSGKSAIINAITPWLNQGFHNSVVYNHLRPHLLPDIAVLLRKRDADEKVEVVSHPHAGTPSGFVGSLARWLYYMHDYTWGYLIKVWPKIRIRSYVYIFDRYYYDYYIDPRRSSTKLPHWILRVGEFCIPKPDLILCLGGEPEKIYARKPETSIEEVTRQTEELKRFAAKRKNAVWIDTTQPIENSICDAKDAILDVMSERFKNIL